MQAQLIPEQEPRRQRSFMLVASGAPRDENWAAGRWGCLRVICATQTPRLGFPPSIGVRGMLSIAGETSWEAILDRSPGHAFIAIAHSGWRRRTKV